MYTNIFDMNYTFENNC